MFYLRTLGGLSLARSDAGGPDALANSKSLLILALLATRPNHSARRDYVAGLLWPDGDRARALRALRQALFYLSRHADDVLIKGEHTLELNRDQVTVDLWEFDRALEAGEYAQAIELYRGPFAAGSERKVGSEAEHWIEAENSRVLVGLEVAYTRAIAHAEAGGDSRRAVELARAFVGLNPVDDRAQQALVRVLRSAGDEVGALRAYEAYRRLTERALGEDPPPELAASMAEVRDELLVPPAVSLPVASAATPSAWDKSAGTILKRPVSRRAVAFSAAAAATLVVVGVVVATSGRTAPVGSLAQLNGKLLASAGTDGSLSVLEVTLAGSGVAVRTVNGLAPTTLPSPDGRARAVLEQAADGWNLSVHMADPPAVRAVTADEGDEYPLAWSPDGRYLVYAHGRLRGDGRTRQHRLLVYDLAADSGWRLTSFESRQRPGAAWSPDGTRIAFSADVRGAAEVFVVDFDGKNLRRVSRHPAVDVDPAWAPDGDRLAFVSRRAGAVDIYTVRPDGSNLRQITHSIEQKRSPAWISPSVIVFVGGSEDDADLWAVDTYTGRTRQLTRRRRLTALIAVHDPRPIWVEGVRIRPRPTLGSPGQHVRFSVDATQPNGDPLASQSLPLHWRVLEPTVAAIGDSGWVRLLNPGRVTLVATVAGWRADTLTFQSVPLTEVRHDPVFREDWLRGINSELWRIFGDPEPYTRPGLGPRGTGMFVNHGDEFFASGAVTRAPFPLGQGITVEVAGRIGFTGKHHQEFGIALYDTEHVDSLLATGRAPALVELRLRGPAVDQRSEAALVTPTGRAVIPLPEHLEAWHAYAIQIQPDGTVELILDGDLYWQASQRLERIPADVYVGLGFQSFETEVAHGPVRVYLPIKYILDETASGSAGGR